MTVMPSNIARVSTLLSSQMVLANLNRGNVSMLDLQTQLSTGRQINRPSDDPVKAASIAALNARLSRAQQQFLNLSHADAVLSSLDQSLGQAGDLVRSAQSIASSQIGIASDATTRSQQAVIVDSIISQIARIANGQTAGVYYFGGSTPGIPPLTQVNGGYRYTGRGSGLTTDIGAGDTIPITLGGDNAIGEVSTRYRSTTDLNPNITASTPLTDLRGGRGLGIANGSVSFSFNGGPTATVDFDGAQNVGDVVNRLSAAITQYETDNSVTVLGASGVTISGGSVQINIAAGANTLSFAEVSNGTTAADLGLTQAAFTPASANSADLDPRLAWSTNLSSLPGLTIPPGSIRLRMTSGSTSILRDVDLSGATNLGDVRNLIESTGMGVRVEINDAGTGLNIFNEVAGPSLSVEEVAGGANTATQLGIRTLDLSTPLADFNNGRGVRIVNGATNPVTGLPDPSLDVDFVVHLGNGNSFNVDLRPQDITDVQSVINRINAAAAAAVVAGDIPAGSFNATLSDAGNGIALQDLGGLGAISVTKANNSAAAQDLGMLNGTWDAPSATFTAQDRAGVRVNNLLTNLMDLRDALMHDDSAGITVAGEGLAASADRLLAAHALVGTYAQRTERTKDLNQDQILLDTKLKEDLQGLDYAAASVRFSQLQTQLSASLATAARVSSVTLFDYLG